MKTQHPPLPVGDSGVRMAPAVERFVLHWGELGPRWGVNRTVAQIHALLYLSERPLTAEEIANTLSVARSNVSTSLRELESWKLVRIVPTLGDRREHYESIQDVWEMFKTILDGRKQREIDPTLEVLRECAAAAKGDAHTQARIDAMKDLFESASDWYADIRPIPASVLRKLMRLGGKVTKIFGAAALVFWLAFGASAATPETLKFETDRSFFTTLTGLKPNDEWKKLLKVGLAQYFRQHTIRPEGGRLRRPAPGEKPVRTVTLGPLRNRQWSSAVLFRIGGAPTALSGQFSRSGKAFFAVNPEGAAAPIFVSLDDMIDEKAAVTVNGRTYRVSLSPNLMDRLSSKVVFTSASDPNLSFGVTMKRILGLVYQDGNAFDWGGVSMRQFYGQDVDDASLPAAAGRMESVVFLLKQGEDYFTYLISKELIPTDGAVREFALKPGLALTLRIHNGVLEVFPQ